MLRLPGAEEVKDALTKLEEGTEKEERGKNVRQSGSGLRKTINIICPVTQVYTVKCKSFLRVTWQMKLADMYLHYNKHGHCGVFLNNPSYTVLWP